MKTVETYLLHNAGYRFLLFISMILCLRQGWVVLAQSCPEPELWNYEMVKGSDPVIQAVLNNYVSKIIPEAIQEYKYPTLYAIAVYNGEILLSQGFGHANPLNPQSEPMGVDNVGYVGSISKSFASLAMLRLRDDGLLHVDDPVDKYLPGFSVQDNARRGLRPIQLRELASHLSGIQRQAPCGGCFLNARNWNSTMNAVESMPLLWDVGLHAQYSNAASGLLTVALGEITKEVYGMTFEEYVGHILFSPLGMDSSTYNYSDVARLVPPSAMLMENGSFFVWPPPNESSPASLYDGAGGALASMRDMVQFLNYVSLPSDSQNQIPEILNPSTLHEWLKMTSIRGYQDDGYGYGLEVHKLPELQRWIYGKDGASTGWLSQWLTVRELRLAVFMTTNIYTAGLKFNALSEALLSDLAVAVESALLPVQPRTKWDADSAANIVGLYEMPLFPGITPISLELAMSTENTVMATVTNFPLATAPIVFELMVDPFTSILRGVRPQPPNCDFMGARDYYWLDGEMIFSGFPTKPVQNITCPGEGWVFYRTN